MSMKKALLIGINYPGRTGLQLNGCVNDVNNIEKFLISKCQYLPQNISKLTDNKASTATIKSEINKLLLGCKSGDTLFFYYSGHGSQITGTAATNKEEPNDDDAIIPVDYQQNGYIDDDWLYANLAAKVPANVTLWSFTDCCHSGTMLDLKYNWVYTPKLKTGRVEKSITEYKDDNWENKFNVSIINTKETQGHVYLFSGCTDEQTSADSFENNSNQGAFSYCLLQYIENNKENFNKKPIAYVLKQINCHLFIKGYTQRSQLSVGKSTDFNVNFTL